jgi:hypothetical protein
LQHEYWILGTWIWHRVLPLKTSKERKS